MCNNIEAKKLPLVPGYSLRDPSKTEFHRSQYLDYRQGIPTSKFYVPAAGNAPRDVDSMQFFEYESPDTSLDPNLIYGRKKVPVKPFKPHYVAYDRTCLRFKGFFMEQAVNTPDEDYRVRVVDLLYFLEDDTVTVIEPAIPNSGLPQGRLVRRSRIPQGPLPDCEYLHWKDLNIGLDYRICGFRIRLVNCDPFTREFLLSQGIDVNSAECIPYDKFRRKMEEPQTQQRSATTDRDFKLRQFLKYDGIVLRFRAMWESSGMKNHYCIAYFLADETIQISEIHEKNDGKDPCAILLKRSKVPKKWDKVELTYPSYLEDTVKEVTEFYQPRDLVVGQKLTIFGREMFIYKCDDFTRNYYCRVMNFPQPENVCVESPRPKPPAPQMPPYTGIGGLEDSLQSYLSITLKSPRKDTVRNIVNANRFLRYKARMWSTHPEDQDREFIISYSLADGRVSINEPPRRNSGHPGGLFLSPMLVPKPGTSRDFPEYYTPHDFYIGATVVINEFRFILTGVDLHVYNYMKDNPEKFKQEVVESVKRYVEAEGLAPRPNIDPTATSKKHVQIQEETQDNNVTL